MMLRTQETLDGEIIVDSFAGGGGASTGIELALGRIVNAAINHDPAAIRMHEANHPYTEHYQRRCARASSSLKTSKSSRRGGRCVRGSR